jgi:hypothetical protein
MNSKVNIKEIMFMYSGIDYFSMFQQAIWKKVEGITIIK